MKLPRIRGSLKQHDCTREQEWVVNVMALCKSIQISGLRKAIFALGSDSDRHCIFLEKERHGCYFICIFQ